MHDWTGTRIRTEALTVPCRYCHADAGQPCITKDREPRELRAFPAHCCRINDAQKETQP
ncbi:zinc finger domain-containing protein [Mycobacterium intracellulare]|uniref:zinc finger domain-containing protein n=1 Tax=Mycobacterium intracellulare TaxID=1767 RepID=UPI003F695276